MMEWWNHGKMGKRGFPTFYYSNIPDRLQLLKHNFTVY
jgi:hypothetical protein